ncbi:MAG: hypothetical protein MUC48_24185 [Leptolyngbya sp. Prado105]|nr:hypothetical protein [Leptolyngbya sp. Prado105]
MNGSIQKLRLKNQAAYDEVYIMRATRQFRVIFAVEDQQQEPESKEIIVLDIFDRDRLTTMYATRIANEEF